MTVIAFMGTGSDPDRAARNAKAPPRGGASGSLRGIFAVLRDRKKARLIRAFLQLLHRLDGCGGRI